MPTRILESRRQQVQHRYFETTENEKGVAALFIFHSLNTATLQSQQIELEGGEAQGSGLENVPLKVIGYSGLLIGRYKAIAKSTEPCAATGVLKAIFIVRLMRRLGCSEIFRSAKDRLPRPYRLLRRSGFQGAN